MENRIVGQVIGLAVRTGVGAAMRELDSVDVAAEGGVEGDVPAPTHRGIEPCADTSFPSGWATVRFSRPTATTGTRERLFFGSRFDHPSNPGDGGDRRRQGWDARGTQRQRRDVVVHGCE